MFETKLSGHNQIGVTAPECPVATGLA